MTTDEAIEVMARHALAQCVEASLGGAVGWENYEDVSEDAWFTIADRVHELADQDAPDTALFLAAYSHLAALADQGV